MDKKFDIGVLFIHGIGTQARGQTLTESGGSLFRWIRERCDAIAKQSTGADPADVDRLQRRLEDVEWGAAAPARGGSDAKDDAQLRRAVLQETRFNDPEDPAAPAHTLMSVLSISSSERVTSDRWLLAESWWAEKFSSPTFKDLARWGLGILPWIVGSHFAAQVKRRLNERPTRPRAPDGLRQGARRDRISAIAGWLWRLTAAIGGLALGLVSTAVMMPVLALLLVLGTIPVPQLRSALLGIQLRMAATLGDCYVLIARPIEAASIVGAVRRDLFWLAEQCSEVVILAHSQGGAVAHLALRGEIPRELKLLFTFGSGLRKLEEARELMRSGSSFAVSAVLTSVALVLFLLCSWALVAVIAGSAPAGAASLAAILVYGVGAVAFLIAGVRDHLRGIPLSELDRWIDRLKSTGPRWVDCYASGDPVPNGLVAGKARDLSREVCNTASMTGDHTTYWANSDEFVSLLYGEIAASRARDPLSDIAVPGEQLRQIAKRRRWRVAIGRAVQWVCVAGVLIVIARTWPAWQAAGLWAWTKGNAWLSSLFGTEAAAMTRFSIDWATLGFLGSVVVPYWVLRRVWMSWNEAEMQHALGLQGRRWPSLVTVLAGLWLFMVIVAGLAADRFPSFWLFMLLLLLPFAFMVGEPSGPARDARIDANRAVDSKTGSPEVSAVESLLSLLIAIGMLAAAPFSFALLLWEIVVWLTGRFFGGAIAGFRPGEISSLAIGAAAAIAALVVLGAHSWWSGRRAEREAADTLPGP